VPTYQYACTECGHAFDQFQSFSDDALTECPQCQGRLRKLFNAVGVVFKGSGFYRTDSRETAKSASSSSSETKAETKTEAKTETKSDTKTEKKSTSAGSKAPVTA
jgi:putative FmdB family regulatory protein